MRTIERTGFLVLGLVLLIGCGRVVYDEGAVIEGILDTSFGTDGAVFSDVGAGVDEGYSITTDNSGNILVAGSVANTNRDFAVFKFNSNGSPETSFGINGVVTYESGGSWDRGYGIAVDSSGKIFATGTINSVGSRDAVVFKYNSDGTLDTSFGTNGMVVYDGGNDDISYDVALDANGKILITGQINDGAQDNLVVLRFNADGSLDTGFGTGGVVTYNGTGSSSGSEIALDSSGRILVAGRALSFDIAVLRFNADGTLDTSFGSNGLASYNGGSTDFGEAIAIGSDGKIVVVGYSRNAADNDIAVLRFNADGTLDATFGNNGAAIYDSGNGGDIGYGVAIDAEGTIMAAGYTTQPAQRAFTVLFYKPDGTLDTSKASNGIFLYAPAGRNSTGRAVALDASGRLLATGWSRDAIYDEVTVWRIK